MKKLLFSVSLVLTLFLTSCGSTGSNALSALVGGLPAVNNNQQTTEIEKQPVMGNGTGSILENLLGDVLGSSKKLSQKSIIGTWNFQGSACVFETENLLMKAGGEVAATKLEEKVNAAMQRVGIRPGSCSYTFNEDGTFKSVMLGRTLSGTYKLDAANKKITMFYLGGIMQSTAHVVLVNNKLSLLYDSDKLLKVVNTMSTLSGSTAARALSQILNAYDGMLVGMELSK